MGPSDKVQKLFEKLLGSKEVYYQPPESIKMSYPAIVYFKSGISTVKANDGNYRKHTKYTVTVIDKRPDHPVIDKLLSLPYCSYDRNYKSDNLEHDVLTLYD